MSFAGANSISRVSFGAQHRFVLLPWFNRKCAVQCHNCSSMPVRYTPKKYRDAKKPGVSLRSNKPFESMGEKPEQVGDPYSAIGFTDTSAPDNLKKSREDEKFERVFRPSTQGTGMLRRSSEAIVARNNSCDHTAMREEHLTKHQRSLSYLPADIDSDENIEMNYHMETMSPEIMEDADEAAEEMEVEDGSSRGNENKLLASRTRLDVEKRAVELLAKRAYTAMELRKKLNAKHFPGHIVEKVLHDFQERGLLNDSLYAESYSRSRWSSSFWGPRRIKRELLKKGVHLGEVESAVKLVFEEGEDSDDHCTRHGLSKPLMDQLYEQASKQWQRSRDVSRDTRKERMVRWLQYRGFDWGAIGAILKRLESQHPP